MTFASRNIRPYVVNFLANIGNSGTGSYGVRAWPASVNFGSFTPTIPYFKGYGVLELYTFPDADRLFLSMQVPPVSAPGGTAPPANAFDVLTYNGVRFLRTSAVTGNSSSPTYGAILRWEWVVSGLPTAGTVSVVLM